MSKIPAAVKKEAKALLGRITMRNLRSHETRNGIAWTGDLYLDGRPLLRVEQEGRGGANTYDPAKGVEFSDARKWEGLLKGACEVLGLGAFEPLDALTSAMEKGMTGIQALPIALEAMAELDAAFPAE